MAIRQQNVLAAQWTPTGTVASDSRPTRHDGVPRADVTRAYLRRPGDADPPG